MDTGPQRSLQQKPKNVAPRQVTVESDITTPPQRRGAHSRADANAITQATQTSQTPTPGAGGAPPPHEVPYLDRDRLLERETHQLSEFADQGILTQPELPSGLDQSIGQADIYEQRQEWLTSQDAGTTQGNASELNGGNFSTGRWSYSEGDDVHIPPPLAVETTAAGLQQGPTASLPAAAAAAAAAAPFQPGPSIASHSTLTPEQRQRMAKRRLEALQRREESARKRAKTSTSARELFPTLPEGEGALALNIPVPASTEDGLIIAHSPPTCASPAAIQRAEANRHAALERRRLKLESEIFEMVQQSVAAGKGPGGAPAWRQRIENDVRKYVTSVRSCSSGAPSTVGTTATPSAVVLQCISDGKKDSSLTPEQQHRMEASKRAALERQQQRIEAHVADFMHNARQKALATMEFGATQKAPLR